VRRARAVAAAACAAALATPAAAYVRTTDRTTGVSVKWPVPVVAYDLSSAPSFPSPSCAPTASGDPVEDAVRASFDAWWPDCGGGSPPGLRLVYGGRIPEIRTGLAGTAENLVVVRNGWCSSQLPASEPCMLDPEVDCGGIYGCFEDHGAADKSTVALTTVLYDPHTGRLFDADMELNGWDGVTGTIHPQPPATSVPHGYYFTCDVRAGWRECTTYGQADCYAYDLRNTVTHEAGHVVGLAHPCDDPGTPSCGDPLPPGEAVPYAQRTMYPSTGPGDTAKRVLSADDVAGVCAVYPVQGGGCGCGSGGEPGPLAPALAALIALALRPRLRR
jgi:MYXO-CTERM domain-containing protein